MSNKKILHVEDDVDLKNYIQTLLSDAADITHASNCAEAYQKLENNQYDMVVLDLTLPDCSGLQIVEKIVTMAQRPSIVIFSAHEVTDTINNVDAVYVKGNYSAQTLAERFKTILSD